MPYHLDLAVFSMEAYKKWLTRPNLLPGRRILWENIGPNFLALEQQGVTQVAQLQKQLSTPGKLESLAKATGVSQEYLTMLKRETGSLTQKPVPLASFPGIDAQALSILSGKNIRNSKEYFESSFPPEEELYCLCDLVRINGVGPLAAKAFYEAGYRSVGEVAIADAAVLLVLVSKVNEAQGYYQARLGLKDMQFCIDFACLLTGIKSDRAKG